MNNLEPISSFWRKCTTCKKPIEFGQKYWICSVSTCNRIRTDLVFCDLRCFDAHVPVMNHRDAGAFERKAPMMANLKEEKKKIEVKSDQPKAGFHQGEANTQEILVVVSKVKDYIRLKSGMNTSGSVMEILSDRLRSYAEAGIESAKKNGRKTLLDRDV